MFLEFLGHGFGSIENDGIVPNLSAFLAVDPDYGSYVCLVGERPTVDIAQCCTVTLYLLNVCLADLMAPACLGVHDNQLATGQLKYLVYTHLAPVTPFDFGLIENQLSIAQLSGHVFFGKPLAAPYTVHGKGFS